MTKQELIDKLKDCRAEAYGRELSASTMPRRSYWEGIKRRVQQVIDTLEED